MLDGNTPQSLVRTVRNRSAHETDQGPGLNVASTKAEAGLDSEAAVIKKQAKQAQPLDKEENLLRGKGEGRKSDAE